MEKTLYIIKDSRNKKYKVKSKGFTRTVWTENKTKAQLFRSIGAAKKGMYSYNINPERGKLGAKIILPDWVEIVPVTVNL